MSARKRYHRPALTFKAWDAVVRELQERLDRQPEREAWLGDIIGKLRYEWDYRETEDK